MTNLIVIDYYTKNGHNWIKTIKIKNKSFIDISFDLS